MARKNPELNLAPELPEVTSRDFNLFYSPQAPIVDRSVKAFTQSLDNFVNGAGFAIAQVSEKKLKQSEEADAVKAYNTNRLAYNQAVEKGLVPKEANPYFINKYQELDLNSKANQFKSLVYQKYADKNVLENPDPNAFDNFYNQELKEFVASQQLSSFDAVALEKGFFSKTSGTREQLFQNHVSAQMGKIGEDYKIRFKENIQAEFNDELSFAEMGANISNFVLDKVNNGLSKTTAREYLLEGLREYASQTGDLEFAEKLLRELPKNIKLGTDVIFNVKSLEDDFNAIKEEIDDRIDQKANDDFKRNKLKLDNENLEAHFFANNYETFTEASQSPEYASFSNYKKTQLRSIYKNRDVGFGSQVNKDVEQTVQDLIEANDFSGALDFLDKNIDRVKENYYYNKLNEINAYKITQTDGLLASDDFTTFKSLLTTLVETQAKGNKINFVDTLIPQKFEKRIRTWLSNNPDKNYENQQTRINEFQEYVRQQFDIEERKILKANEIDSGVTGDVEVNENKPVEEANPEKLNEKKKTTRKPNTRAGGVKAEDSELKIDLSKVVIIPNNLTRGQRVKFKKDNPNSMTQEEYDRILKKQTAFQIAQGDKQ